jgi:glucose-6-phosphate dehydrogenase assembly protein OpcA
MATPLQPVLESPREVDVADLEAELSALWRSAAEGPSGSSVVSRACALTLLVSVETEDEAWEVSGLIGDVTRQNPCRTIVMASESAARPSGINAWISAHCHLPVDGEKQVCSEQVTVVARGDSVRALPNVALPLVVPGLPIYLWWRAPRFDPAPHFDDILRVTDRVLFDSGRFPEPASDLPRLAQRAREEGIRMGFSDLNWVRMTPWRELIAQCFDPSQLRPYLSRLKSVGIEYEKISPRRTAQEAQALLLAGWLASRLGWEPVGPASGAPDGSRTFVFKSAEGGVEARLVPRDFAGGGEGMCFGINLDAVGDPPARFRLARGPEGISVTTECFVEGREPISRNVRLEVLEEVEVVNDELKYLGRNHVFEQALAMVGRMAGP